MLRTAKQKQGSIGGTVKEELHVLKGLGQEKLKPHRHGDTIECHEGKHDKQERTCGCNEKHMAVDHKSRQKKKKRQRKQM